MCHFFMVTAMPGADASQATDGRARRRVRSSEAVAQAALDVLREGDVQLTAQAVSERSGVSIRSVFRLFQDMDALHAVAIERQSEHVKGLIVDLDANAPLADRIDALVANRAEIYEYIAPVRRHAIRMAPTSTPIREGLHQANRVFGRQVRQLFAADLQAPQAPGTLAEAVDAATSWETWDRLRSAQGLSVSKARQTMALMLHAILTGAREREPSR